MADQKTPDSPTLRNHKRQFAWQIVVPFLVMAGVIIAGVVLVVSGGSKQTGVWADVSIIWMLIPLLVLALFLAAVLGLLIYGMAKLTQIMPRFTGRAQGFADAVSVGARKVADGSAKPVMWVHQVGAVIKSLIPKL